MIHVLFHIIDFTEWRPQKLRLKPPNLMPDFLILTRPRTVGRTMWSFTDVGSIREKITSHVNTFNVYTSLCVQTPGSVVYCIHVVINTVIQ